MHIQYMPQSKQAFWRRYWTWLLINHPRTVTSKYEHPSPILYKLIRRAARAGYSLEEICAMYDHPKL
jgi:hypothetical protein